MSTFTRLSLSLSFLAVSTLAMPIFAAAAPAAVAPAYTFVVGEPYVGEAQTGAKFYSDLFTNVQNAQPFAVNRLLLTVTYNDNTFQPGGAGQSGGAGYQFLQEMQQLPVASRPEIYALLDVEAASPWQWTKPVNAPNSGACKDLASGYFSSVAIPDSKLNPSSVQVAMMQSICLAQIINANLGSNVIQGVAYDNQGDAYTFKSPTDVLALMQEANNSGLKLGWISGGIQPVDLSLVEVYDQSKGATASDRVDNIMPSTIPSLIADPLPPDYKATLCNAVPGFDPPSNDACNYPSMFPGTQVTINGTDNKGNTIPVGAVSANIYQCALAQGQSIDDCDMNSADPNSYAANVDVTASPDVQMLQSLNYIYRDQSKTPLAGPAIFGKIPLGAPSDASVVFLFSTQYFGLVGSTENACTPGGGGNCGCVASQYNSTASCGSENGFGTWGNHLQDFLNFVYGANPANQIGGFMSSQCPAGMMPGTASCEAGIYMYDFIPQAWFNGVGS